MTYQQVTRGPSTTLSILLSGFHVLLVVSPGGSFKLGQISCSQVAYMLNIYWTFCSVGDSINFEFDDFHMPNHLIMTEKV